MSLIDDLRDIRENAKEQRGLAEKAITGTHAMYVRLVEQLRIQVEGFRSEFDMNTKDHTVYGGGGYRVQRELFPRFQLILREGNGAIEVTSTFHENANFESETTNSIIPIHAGSGQGELYYILEGKKQADPEDVATAILRPIFEFFVRATA